jgi:hypothetical protein
MVKKKKQSGNEEWRIDAAKKKEDVIFTDASSNNEEEENGGDGVAEFLSSHNSEEAVTIVTASEDGEKQVAEVQSDASVEEKREVIKAKLPDNQGDAITASDVSPRPQAAKVAYNPPPLDRPRRAVKPQSPAAPVVSSGTHSPTQESYKISDTAIAISGNIAVVRMSALEMSHVLSWIREQKWFFNFIDDAEKQRRLGFTGVIESALLDAGINVDPMWWKGKDVAVEVEVYLLRFLREYFAKENKTFVHGVEAFRKLLSKVD